MDRTYLREVRQAVARWREKKDAEAFKAEIAAIEEQNLSVELESIPLATSFTLSLNGYDRN